MRIPLLALLLAMALPGGCGDDSEVRRDGRPAPGDLFPWIKDKPPGCSPANCTGCCQGSSCQNGTSTTACGYGGISCRACATNEQCRDGVCTGGTATCDATNCAKGCCDSTGNCKTGGTDQVCGTGGAACKACDTATQACMSGQCVTKGSGSFKITLVSATILENCGFGESCDPYVELTIAGTTKASTYKSDTDKPVWNEELMTAAENDILAGMGVKVLDDDYGPDDNIDACDLKVASTDLAAGKLVAPCGARVKDLTFTFAPVN